MTTAATKVDTDPMFADLRAMAKSEGLTLGFRGRLYILRTPEPKDYTVVYSTVDLIEMAAYITDLGPAEDTADADTVEPPEEVVAQDMPEPSPMHGKKPRQDGPSRKVALVRDAWQNRDERVEDTAEPTEVAAEDPEPVPAPVEPAAPAPLDVVEAVGNTWVMSQEDSDGSTTYWLQAGGYSPLIRQGIAIWPNKKDAEVDVRDALGGTLPRSHKAIKLTEEQAFNIDSPYRAVQGELVVDADLPTEFSEMELDELITVADRWVSKAQTRAVAANKAMGSAVEAAWYGGSALLEAKAKVRARGLKWIPWLEQSNFHGSARLAQYYMALAKNRNAVSFLDHDVSLRSAIKQITVTKNPQPSNKFQTSDTDKAKKKLTKLVAAKLTMINEVGTYITDLEATVKRLAGHRDHKPVNTFTSTEVDTITAWLESLRGISLKLQELVNTVDLNGIGDA